MTLLTIPMIRAMEPCVDPTIYAPEDWTGTVLDVLKMESVSDNHALWLACQFGVLPERTRRLMACAFVRHTPIGDGRTVWDLLTDERSKNAVEVAERYANGQVTEEELSAASDTANAAYAAAADAAYAAYAATYAAAYATRAATNATRAAANAAANAATNAAQRQIAIRVIEEN